MGLYTHTHTHTHTDSLENKKGITLVALVVTIVVLLILAGVSINLVLGENGLITKAQEAKRKSHEESIKEQADMALASYQLEKAKNGEDTSLDGNKIENLEIIEENPSEDVKFIAKADDRIIIMKSDGTSIVTKENLVRNGFVTNGNENFSGTTEKNGVLLFNSGKDHFITSTDYIEIDPSKKYYEGIIAKTNNTKAFDYIGFVEYDCDKNIIDDTKVLYVENSLTFLTKDLNDGDTEVYFSDLNGFKSPNNNYFYNGLIFWNYKDSTGYQYPEQTYSRNVFYDLFDSDGIDLENNKITLKKSWKSGKIEKNTKVSQTSRGENHNYGVLEGNLSGNYKLYSNYIQGINNRGYGNFVKFRNGTKYVRILFRLNYAGLENVSTEVKDIIFAECE